MSTVGTYTVESSDKEPGKEGMQGSNLAYNSMRFVQLSLLFVHKGSICIVTHENSNKE